MPGALLLCLALTFSAPVLASAQPPEPPSAEDLSIQAFIQALENAVVSADSQRWADLLSGSADRTKSIEFFDSVVPQGITRAVAKERDRAPLVGTLPGDGYRLITEIFIETGPRGRITTWNVDIRKPRDDEDPQPWRIVAADRLSSVEGLHRLVMAPGKQFKAHDLVLQAVDFEVKLPAGHVFVAEAGEGVTALVLLGDGNIVFSPKPLEEKGQVRIFTGSDTLEAAFTTALVRLNPSDYAALVKDTMLTAADAVDPRLLRRAQEVFNDDIGNSFSLDLSDLSRDTWSLLPQMGDFVAEVRTRRFDKLTYARSSNEPEDVSLFQRARKRNISIYASEQKLASRGQFYNEDDLVDYDILDYTLDTSFTPDREWLEGRSRMRLRVQSFGLAAVTLKLAESLTVSSITSDELGRLLFLRVRNQNAIVINLPSIVPQGTVLTLHLAYQGRVVRQGINDESVEVAADQGGGGQAGGRARTFEESGDMPLVPPEPNWLFSSRAQWYPQGQVTDYATATMRITVPSEYAVVASGVQAAGSPTFMAPLSNGQERTLFTFVASQPLRYLSMVVSRMMRADAATVALDIVPPPELLAGLVTNGRGPEGGPAAARPRVPPYGSRNTVALTVDANRRQEGRSRDLVPAVADILRLYASVIGDVPYDALNLAMVEADLPGGHAPGYVAVINNPLPTSPFSWRNDPANFSNFPEFFVAHELAHQWFGQAVGWKNYHEQWLSEGFAQYMAALFARERRGETAFRDILKQFRRWGIDHSEDGPIYLGYRLGHIKGESRIFRALVYNKGALILHMLRRFIGDEAFFDGVQRYYREHRFTKAGTGDLQKAMELESGRDLSRFFQRWVFESGIPRLRYSTSMTAEMAIVRLEQSEAELYDLPVTVTIVYADGKTTEEVVRVSEAVTDARIPLTGAVRSIDVNLDWAALAHFDRARN